MLAVPVGAAARLHHIRVQRSLDQELGRAAWIGICGVAFGDPPGGLLEGPDEFPADDLALGFGVGDAGQCRGEVGLRVDDDQIDSRRRDEVMLDLLGLAFA